MKRERHRDSETDTRRQTNQQKRHTHSRESAKLRASAESFLLSNKNFYRCAKNAPASIYVNRSFYNKQ